MRTRTREMKTQQIEGLTAEVAQSEADITDFNEHLASSDSNLKVDARVVAVMHAIYVFRDCHNVHPALVQHQTFTKYIPQHDRITDTSEVIKHSEPRRMLN